MTVSFAMTVTLQTNTQLQNCKYVVFTRTSGGIEMEILQLFKFWNNFYFYYHCKIEKLRWYDFYIIAFNKIVKLQWFAIVI